MEEAHRGTEGLVQISVYFNLDIRAARYSVQRKLVWLHAWNSRYLYIYKIPGNIFLGTMADTDQLISYRSPSFKLLIIQIISYMNFVVILRSKV